MPTGPNTLLRRPAFPEPPLHHHTELHHGLSNPPDNNLGKQGLWWHPTIWSDILTRSLLSESQEETAAEGGPPYLTKVSEPSEQEARDPRGISDLR